MKAFVDPEKCIGCGLCASIAPEIFEMNDDDLAEAIQDDLTDSQIPEAKDCVEQCPTEAIEVK